MKIEYCAVVEGNENEIEILDRITWDDIDAPTYDTGRARQLVEGKTHILGAPLAREQLRHGWSNGYVLTRTV